MAYDRSEDTYHLTPRGWETADPRPADAVETWVRDMYQASGYSRELVSWKCIWANRSVARIDRDQLRDKHKAFLGSPGRTRGRWGRETSIGEPL
jgi:hypothetical protein